MNLNAYGSSLIKLSGSENNLWVDACGSGGVDLTDYRVEDATLQVSCSSTVIVNVTGKLDGDTAQNARGYLVGYPELNYLSVHENASLAPK